MARSTAPGKSWRVADPVRDERIGNGPFIAPRDIYCTRLHAVVLKRV